MSQSTSISQHSMKGGKSVADQTTWSDCQYRSHSYIFSHGPCIPIRLYSLQCAKDYMQCILFTTQKTASDKLWLLKKPLQGPKQDNVQFSPAGGFHIWAVKLGILVTALMEPPWSAEEVCTGAKTHAIDKFWVLFSTNEPSQRFLGAQRVA